MILKKIAAAAMAALCGSCLFIPLEASATIYDSRDINFNGSVTSADATLFERYLKGEIYFANNHYLDVDKNGIISMSDYDCIMDGVNNNDTYVNHTYNDDYDYYADENASPPGTQLTTSAQFVKHRYANNSTSFYTLSMTEGVGVSSMVNEPETPRSVVGGDSRVPVADTGIVLITKPNNSLRATGFIVGDHVIATAAHCVYDRSTDDWDNFTVHPTNTVGNGVLTTTFNVKEAHINKGYYNGSNNGSTDYALLYVSDDLSGYYHYQIGMTYDAPYLYSFSSLSNYSYFVSGFSGTIPGGGNNPSPYQIYRGVGTLATPPAYPELFCHTADLIAGASGSPVYVLENLTVNDVHYQRRTAISIQTDDYGPDGPQNMGPIITPIMLRFYYTNGYVNSTTYSGQ